MNDPVTESNRLRLRSDLQALGLREGDHVVLRVSLKSLGIPRPAETLVRAILDVVGPSGSLYALAFTREFPLPLRGGAHHYVFDRDTPAVTGGLANHLLGCPDSVRSRHPTNSFVGIGRFAHDLLRSHGPGSPSFEPVRRLAEHEHGRMLLVGRLFESPGFSTVHVAQHLLGFQNRTVGRYGVRYRAPDGTVRLFVRDDAAGCSRGFHRFYPAYFEAHAVTEGRVASADCLLGTLSRTLAVDLEVLRRDPTFFFCDDLGCESCRRNWGFHREPAYRYYPARAMRAFRALRRQGFPRLLAALQDWFPASRERR